MTSGKTDELKGRVKEAAGALTGDAKLKREGKTDRPSAQRSIVSATRWATERERMPDRFGGGSPGLDAWTVRFTSI
jgi:hypothetical protein